MATAREEVNKAQPIFTGSEGWPCSMVFLLSSMLPRSMYLKQDLGKIHPLPSGNNSNSNRASEQGTTNSCRGSVCSCFPFESPLKEDQGKNQMDYPFLFHPHFPVNTATAGGSHQDTIFSHKG